MSRPQRRVDLLLVVILTGVLAGLGIGGYKLWSWRHDASTARPSASGTPATLADRELRLVPPEAYMRTYLELFGGLAPLAVQQKARGPEKLFDTWDDYVSALGLPDYRTDIPRQTQTNTLMVSTFERLGIALCDRAVEHDLGGKEPVAVDKRLVFGFELPKGSLDEASFKPRFDVMHRLFLGYPASIAPTDRVKRFFDLYTSIVDEKDAPKSKLSPEERGWAGVCYGLIRHPEFHLY